MISPGSPGGTYLKAANSTGGINEEEETTDPPGADRRAGEDFRSDWASSSASRLISINVAICASSSVYVV